MKVHLGHNDTNCSFVKNVFTGIGIPFLIAGKDAIDH